MAIPGPGRLTTGTNSTPADERRLRKAEGRELAMRAYKNNLESLDRTESAARPVAGR
jgi:hypothetical protein